MSRRKLKKKVKSLFFVVLIIAIGLVGYKVYTNLDTGKQFTIIPKEDEKPKEVWPKVYEASMVATGDALLHNPILNFGYDSKTDTYDFSDALVLVKDIISSYDIAYYNQETVFGGKEIGYSSYPTFNSPSSFGDNMRDIGFNLVSLASNHSADCRKNAYKCITNSYNYWKETDAVFDGFNEDETMENYHNIGEVNGITYGFLNYTNTLNGLDGYITKKYIIDLYDEEKVKKEVTELRDKVDVLIVAMHWHLNSGEYSFNPTTANKNIAKYLDSLGVDIILGTYSHCVQPFDVLENGAVVFYSLGNFISNQIALNDVKLANGNRKYHPYVGTIGMLASMKITKTVYEDGTKEITIGDFGADLLYSYRESSGKGYLVVPFSKMTTKYNSNYQSLYNEYSGYITKLNKNITIKEAGIDA